MVRRFARSSFGGRSQAPKRQIENFAICGTWDGITTVVGTVKAVGSVGVAIGDDPVTVVRTRGHAGFLIRTGVADSIICGAIGLYVVTTDAFAIGVTALPGPLTDANNDWFMWQTFQLFGNSSAVNSIASTLRFDFDSRGMRKLKDGDVLAMMLEYESNVAAVVIDGGYAFRNQFKR